MVELKHERFARLPDLVDRLTSTISQLRERTRDTPIGPVILFLDWKLRVMPAYSPDRVFEENIRELRRAASMLGEIRFN
jgi:hypothetical protein